MIDSTTWAQILAGKQTAQERKFGDFERRRLATVKTLKRVDPWEGWIAAK